MPADKTPYIANKGRQAPSSTEASLVAVGVITGAHGIRGQVKIRSFTTDPYDIADYDPLLNETGSKRYELKIDAATKNGLVGTVKGIKNRNEAELMKGTKFFIDKTKIPDADEDEFFYEELVGLKVRDASGAAIGTVTAMYDFGAGDIIEIKHSDGAKEMYPFTRASFPDVKVTDGYISAELPEFVEARDERE